MSALMVPMYILYTTCQRGGGGIRLVRGGGDYGTNVNFVYDLSGGGGDGELIYLFEIRVSGSKFFGFYCIIYRDIQGHIHTANKHTVHPAYVYTKGTHTYSKQTQFIPHTCTQNGHIHTANKHIVHPAYVYTTGTHTQNGHIYSKQTYSSPSIRVHKWDTYIQQTNI